MALRESVSWEAIFSESGDVVSHGKSGWGLWDPSRGQHVVHGSGSYLQGSTDGTL